MLKSAVAPQAEPVNNVRSAKQPAHGAFDNTPRMVMQRQQLLALAPTAPQGQAVVQRMKLYVRTKDGGRAVHINEYHFASLMAQASISSSASGGAHSVVLRPFDDFNGLALAAEAHTADNSGFEFGGIAWGWNGANELFPVADGNACVDVPGEFFDELISQARDPGKVTQNLANNKAATAVYKALPKKGNDEDDSSGGATEGAIISVPFTFNIGALPANVVFDKGKKGAGFIYAKGMDQNSYHLHLFFDDSELPSPTVTSLCLTSRKSGNHFNVPAKKKSPWSSDPDRQQLDDHQRNLALLATVRRSTGEDSSSSSSSSSTSKTKGSNKTEVEEKKPWENDTEQLSIDDLAKKLRVDKSVLEELIQADEATLEELQEFDAKTFHAVYMNQ